MYYMCVYTPGQCVLFVCMYVVLYPVVLCVCCMCMLCVYVCCVCVVCVICLYVCVYVCMYVCRPASNGIWCMVAPPFFAV